MASPPASDGGASSCSGAATGNVEPAGTSSASRYRPTNDDLSPTWHVLHPVHGGASEVRTRAELCVVSFLRAVKEKPDWTAKVVDDAITARWTAEALAAGGEGGRDSNASATAADNAVQEGDPPAPLTPARAPPTAAPATTTAASLRGGVAGGIVAVAPPPLQGGASRRGGAACRPAVAGQGRDVGQRRGGRCPRTHHAVLFSGA